MSLILPKVMKCARGVLVLAVFLLPAAGFAYHTDVADFKLSASVIESFDDNITLARDNTRSDSSTNLNLGLEGTMEGKTRQLSLSASLTYQMFQTYSEFDNNSERLNARFAEEFSKHDRLAVFERLTHAEDPQSFEDEFGRTSGRYSYITNTAGFEYVHEFSAQTSVIGRYTNDIYDPGRSDLAASYGNRVSLESDYLVSSRLLSYAAYDFFRREFDPGSAAVFHILSAGCRYYFTSQLYLNCRSGVSFIDSYNGRDYTKPLVNLSLVNELDRKTVSSVSYVKDYTANSSTQDLFAYWQTAASLSRQVFERLGVGANIFYGEGTYRTFDIIDEFTGASISMTYELRHNVRLLVQYSYSQAESNDPGRDYERNLVSAGLRTEF